MAREQTKRAPSMLLPVPGRDHLQGPSEAPLALVEYGDYECPYCGAAFPIIKAVQERLGDQLCFAFRNFPLANSHPHALHAAQAAEAAGAQGRFWEMHDALFRNQEALEDADLARYAEALGLDGERLLSEVEAGVYLARVEEDFRSGARSGVNGTPTLFINGARFGGERTVEELIEALRRGVPKEV